MLNKLLFLLCRFIWWATPLWLSDLIYRKTNYLTSYRFELGTGKPVAFYFKSYDPLLARPNKGFMVKHELEVSKVKATVSRR